MGNHSEGEVRSRSRWDNLYYGHSLVGRGGALLRFKYIPCGRAILNVTLGEDCECIMQA